jgi:uncharacterized membrane protein YcaP (DUF421 family)
MSGVLRAILGYYFLVFMMRIAGRRPGKQLTPVDFILVFFSGGLVLTTTVGDDKSLTNAFAQIAAIAAAHYLLVILRSRWPAFGRIADGTPLVLFERGHWKSQTMRNMLIQDADVMATARDQGIENLEQIDYAVLERNGQISIISNENAR